MRLAGLPGDPQSSGPPARSGVRRWALRLAAGALGLVALLVCALLVVVHSLDRPWLKRRIQTIARTSGGVDIDYASVRLALFSGAAIDGLVVQSPSEVRAFAPELVRIDRVAVRWRIGTLLGRGPALDSIDVSGVALSVVVDEKGRTSFDAIPSSGPSAPPSPPVPFSHQAASFLASPPPVSHLAVDGVKGTLLRTDAGEVVERTTLSGLGVALVATPAARGWRVNIELGSPTKPLDLELARAIAATRAAAKAKLALTLDATSEVVNAAVDLQMMEQSFAPNVAADHWLHAEAGLRFDPAAGKTEITLDHTQAGDGAASAFASVEVPDSGDPVVRQAHGDADLGRLLKWVPAGLVPVTVDRATLHYQVDSLVAGAVPHLAAGGTVAIDADLANVQGSVGGGPLRVESGKLSIHAQPADDGGMSGKGTVKLTAATVTSGDNRVTADNLDVDFDGRQARQGDISGHAVVSVGQARVDGPSRVVIRDARVRLDLDGLVPGTPDPLTTRGDVTLSLAIGSVDARSATMRANAEGVALRVHTRLEGHAPYAMDLDAPIAHLRVADAKGRPLVEGPLHLELDARDVVPNLAAPQATRGAARATVDLGDVKASLDATKAEDAVDFTFQAAVPSLKIVRPFLPPAALNGAPWDQIGVTAHSSGRVERLHTGAPVLQETSEIDLEHGAFDNVSARSLVLALKSKGNALDHQVDADLHAQGLVVAGGAASDDHVTLSAEIHREKPSLRFQVQTEGRAATKVSLSASFDAAHHAIPYDVDVHLGGLAPIAPLLAKVHGLEGFDFPALEVNFASRGAVLGLVRSVGRDGSVQMEPIPSRTVGVEGTMDLRVAHLQWARGDNGIVAPGVVWHGELHATGARRTVTSHLEADSLHLDLGPKDVDIARIGHDSTAVVVGDLVDPETELTSKTTLGAVKQDFAPEYAVGDVLFELTTTRDRDGLIHVADMKLENGAGGTKLGVSGNVEIGAGRRTLSLTTTFAQDLARLAIAGRFTGKGNLAIEATTTSPDLSLYRVRAMLKGEDVSLALPKAGLELETANGQVPITVALEVGRDGVMLRPDAARSRYSMLRFTDQHPLLARSGFLSITSLKTPLLTIAPLVGNLEIEQNFVSLRQFEMGVRGGSITGQLGLDWDGPKSTLELHVRAAGVQSSHGEPFDGNIAVLISAADRTVEGRAEILRIGERHLLDLLDMQDPLHVDPAMNRIRTALLVGYPDRLRLVFDHGFASARLELGGLARLISIGELRGIPMGPIIDKFLAPMLDPKDGP